MIELTLSTEVELNEIDLDGRLDAKTGIRYIGRAKRQLDGTWVCLANVNNRLCLVEVTVARVPGDGINVPGLAKS